MVFDKQNSILSSEINSNDSSERDMGEIVEKEQPTAINKINFKAYHHETTFKPYSVRQSLE